LYRSANQVQQQNLLEKTGTFVAERERRSPLNFKINSYYRDFPQRNATAPIAVPGGRKI